MQNSSNKKIYLKIFLLLWLFYFLVTRAAKLPLIFPDEAGYMGWAYRLLYGSGSGLRYLPGYSVLLVPVLGIFKDIAVAYPVITALNSLLLALFGVVIFRLSEIFCSENRLLVTLAVCMYPAIGLNAGFAMCESLLCLLFALLVLSVHRLSGNINSLKHWLAAVLLAGYLCITHSRAIAVLPALVLSLLPLVYKRGKRGIKLAFSVILAAGFAGAAALFAYLLSDKDTVNAAHLVNQIKNLFTLRGFGSFLGTVVSQFSYLVLSSFGFIVTGLYYTVKMLKKHFETALFMLLSFGFTAVLSAVFMYHHENPAHILYGRYNEYVVYAILLAGLAGFIKNGAKLRLWLISAVPCVITAVLYGGSFSGLDYNMTHTWGIYIYKLLFYEFSFVPAALMFAALSAAIFAVSKKSRKVSVCLLGILFAASLVFTAHDYFAKGAAPRYEKSQVVSFLEGQSEIDVDALTENSMVYPWEYFNYTVQNPGLSHKEGADLILSERELDAALLGAEKYSHLMLYSKTADAASGVDTRGKPEASVSVSAEGSTLMLDIVNTGRPWLCRDASADIRKTVRAGLRVYRDGKLISDLRADFQDNVYDRAYAEFEFTYPDGDYIIVAETVREFLYRGSEAAYTLTKHGNKLTLSETDFSESCGFTEFDPLSIPGNSGFYRYYADGTATVENILLEGDVLVLETFGEHSELSVEVYADGEKLEFLKFEDGSYYYRLGKQTESLKIVSETYRYSENPLEFLTTESNFKPVDLFVRGMKKVLGIRLDHRSYGVDIQKIKIIKEENS